MIALLKKEIHSFFASPIGYLVIGLFLTLNGLFLWLFKGEYNILDNGFSDLSAFFTLAPWVFIFLIPAITMRSFSDEIRQGTLELLLTKPISHLKIVLGKYFGALVLILLALLPTLLYVYTINALGNPIGNFDLGSTLGSYLGLFFLAAAFTAIGIFASTLSNNQIVAFIIAVLLCFVFYFGFNGLADLFANDAFAMFGIDAHYKSMSRGVIDTRDSIYFVSLAGFFIYVSSKMINTNGIKASIKQLVIAFALLIGLNVLGTLAHQRFDLTQDNRYTLSEATLNIVNSAETPVIIDVLLDGEDFPSEFRRLKTETRQMLEEFSAENSNVKFNFINPLEDPATQDRNIESLNARGLTPMQMSVKESGKTLNKVFFPWALASYNEVTVKIPLIKNKIGASQQELVNNSVQHLEYAFADGISKLVFPKRRKIAILRGNGQLENKNIADFVTTLRDYYFIAPFTLDSVASNAQSTLDKLKAYDLIISAKPTQGFTEAEKQVLDQYTMQGGKSMWLVDKVIMDTDSLYQTGSSVAIGRDLNLTDFFFKYGLRINPVLVNDLYSAPILLANGEGSQAQFQQYPWFYSPLVNVESTHPIVNNINLVKFDYANQIDTLKNTIAKTILLQSSLLSKLDGTPREINLNMINKEPDPKAYTKGYIPLAVLLEGTFTSVYKNRVKPVNLNDKQDQSTATKMIVIADGDLIKNEVGKNGPLELGFDRATGEVYGNKEFLLNSVNYLLDDDGLINIRSKEISIAFMNQERIASEKTKWQLVNIALPLVLLGVFGLGFNYFRKRRYAK